MIHHAPISKLICLLRVQRNNTKSHQNMLQFNSALAWTMSRPVSKTYGEQASSKKWLTKIKTCLAAEKKKKNKKSLEDENESSLNILGIKKAVERDGPLFTGPYASSSTLHVHVGGHAPEQYSRNEPEAEMWRGVLKDAWKREVWDPWSAGIESRRYLDDGYELVRASSKELRRVHFEKIGMQELCESMGSRR